jgi:hypothetical protein
MMPEMWASVALFVAVPVAILACNAPSLIEKWVKGRADEQLILLKHSMVERGMSVEEIERVVAAGTTSSGPDKAETAAAAN